MMSKFFRGILSIFLCFCLVCSICGVGFATGLGPGSWDIIDLPGVDRNEELQDDEVPDDQQDDEEDDEVSLETLPPVIDDGETSDADSSSDPAPVETYTDFDGSIPFDPGYIDSGIADIPGGDTPAYDSSDIALDSNSGGSDVVVGGSSGDVTYIELPEDYVIKSSSLDDMYAIDPQSALAPVTPANTSGPKSVLLSILGTYDPIVAEYQYVNNGSYANYIREIQPDYVWLSSAAIFAILLYSTWRLLGGLLCKK